LLKPDPTTSSRRDSRKNLGHRWPLSQPAHLVGQVLL
jgi:hypothetical protein